MQNRYAGDIGDFSKLGILRSLFSCGLTIGINWYLTPDETHNGDGRHIKYLEKESFRACDESLWSSLKRIVDSGRRNICSLQDERILPAVYYSAMLDYSGKTKKERAGFREVWHKEALACLSDVDIVCADPDNGLIVPSAVGTRRENKFILPEELKDYFKQGSSIIYYQHKARKLDPFYIEQHHRLLADPELAGSAGLALKFLSTSQRYYFFIVQPRHREIIKDAMEQMLQTAWGDYFQLLCPVPSSKSK